ncbi:uncharacterized protein METZ01_LOCUS128980 [marine metagenome]|uniref:Uncharacterized protein n=1 Tax=marine metagenome TaxID=408172 RepID=A0A381YG73_9ZZZZ
MLKQCPARIAMSYYGDSKRNWAGTKFSVIYKFVLQPVYSSSLHLTNRFTVRTYKILAFQGPILVYLWGKRFLCSYSSPSFDLLLYYGIYLFKFTVRLLHSLKHSPGCLNSST